MDEPAAPTAPLVPLIAEVVAGVPEIAAAWLFGSRARGTARDDSDVDIGVLYRAGNRDVHDRVATDIAVAVARATGIEHVDVIDLESQGPIFAHRVLCDGVMLHESDRPHRVDFASNTMSHAFDFMPTHRIATRTKATTLRRWLAERYDL